MITGEDILNRIYEIVEIYKPYDESGVFRLGKSKKNGDEEYPEYYPGYGLLVKDYEDIKVHAERQSFPERLFKEKSPNMSEEEEKYLKANFKSTTLPVYIDFVNSVRRAFSDGNWSIDYEDEEGVYERANKTFKEYVSDQLNIEDYIRNIVVNTKLKDPNGVIAIKPYKIPTVEREDDNGEPVRVIDESQLIEPRPFYYNVKKVVGIDEDSVIIETGEKSIVTYRNAQQAIGKVYEVYTKTELYKVVQVGKYTDWEFELQLIFQHDLGYIPAFRLGGEPFLKDNEIHYQSPFLFAVDKLDLALINKNNLEVSKQLTMYPFRVMVGDPCDFEEDGYHCKDGIIDIWDGEKQVKKQCPACHGSGLQTRPHRQGMLLIEQRRGDNTLAGDNVKPSEAIHYAQPSPEALKYVDQTIEKDTQDARRILHLKDHNSEAMPEDTATGRMIDREDVYAFISPISNQVFKVWYEILWGIGMMRYGSSFKGFKMHPAQTFAFKTKQDYLQEIKAAQEIGNPMMITNAVVDYLEYTYHAETSRTTLLELITTADRLFAFSTEEVTKALANRTIEPWEKILHDSALYFVDQLILEDPNYLKGELPDQIEKLQEKAREKAGMMVSQAQSQEDLIQRALTGGTQ